MATYIQGIQDYIPQIQPFKPDFNFFQAALEQKQQQYQAGYNKISSIYGQLLNSELLRESNEERRNALFTQIDSDIKRLSGVDLSLQENVYQASKLFQPLIDNPYFRKDVAYTKQHGSELRRAQGIKNNPDPKSDERWWEEGERALYYQAEDFSKSSDEESMRFQNPRYTPFIDTTTKLFKFAAENDINPEVLSESGGFIFKHTNGERAIPILQNVFSSVLLSDPRVKAMTYTQSYLDRKNYMKGNAAKFNGDEYAAETEYLNTKLAEINDYYKRINAADEETKNTITTKKKVLEQKIQNEGIDPDLDKDLVAMYQNLTKDAQVQDTVLDKNKSVLTQTDGFDVNTMDRESLRYRVDNALSYFQIDDLANQTATSYAMAKEKIDYKVNPYTLEKVKHGYAMALEGSRFEHDKILKMMDIATEWLKNNGDGSPGSTLNPINHTGIPFDVPGPGNVATGVDIQKRTGTFIEELEKGGAGLTLQNARELINQQNAILLDPTKTDAEKAAADQVIKQTIGEYQIVEKTPAVTTTERGGWEDIGQTILGASMIPGISAIPIIGPILSMVGIGARVAGAGSVIGGPAMAAEGAKNLYGKETTTPETPTKTKGLATKGADGKWSLVTPEQSIGLIDPASSEYYNETNRRIMQHMSEYAKLNPKDPNVAALKTAMEERTEVINNEQTLLQLGRDVFVQNNKVILSAMAGDVGTSSSNASLFLTEDGTRARTENEFITAYVAANKDNTKDYPQTTFMSYVLGSTFSDITGDRSNSVSEEDRLADMREDAADLYEELTESYQELAKNPDASLPIKAAFDPTLVNMAGINAFFGTGKMYGFDAAGYLDEGYQMGMDFFTKDFMPNVGSKTFMDEAGIKVGFGNGFDITRDDYEEFETDTKAVNVLKGFLSSAAMNYGGKTGENQKRPTGRYYLHALAAGTADKVAITWEIDPSWINDNAGDDKKKGIAFDLQKHYNETGNSAITFFMDADKAKSIGFTSMKSTPEEMILNMAGKLDLTAQAEYGGMASLTPDQFGGINYSGYYKTVNELGEKINNPIFGNTTSDINATAEFFRNFYKQASITNMGFENNLKNNSQNKVYNPQELLENAE
jgi:hypothetical protein